MNGSFRILEVNHTGITVSDLERSLAFWRDVFGFELSHRAHQKGELGEKITGVPDAEILIAVLKAPGHKIELLQYLAPPDRRTLDSRPCDVGAAHIALTVENLEVVVHAMTAHGWKVAGEPQTLTAGPNAGKRVIYARDDDGTTVELMGLPPS